MKIVIAPDSFKESLSAKEVAAAIKEGLSSVFPQAEFCLVPMADGGEGTLDTLINDTEGEFFEETVFGPLNNEVKALYGALGDGKTAVIEMAQSSGLMLVSKEERNVMKATTRGTGQLIKAALDRGFRRFIISLGGSATTDCGTGALAELGVKFLDTAGKEIFPCGEGLSQISSIDTSQLDSRIFESELVIASDVDNPLLGPKGAVDVYAKQKGASDNQLKELNLGFENFAKQVKKALNKEVSEIPGAGAAGGIAAGLIAFLNAKIELGGPMIAKIVELEEKMEGADLVVTGEGEINEQTIYGKTPICVAKIAKSKQIKVIAFTGHLGEGYELVHEHGIDAAFSISSGIFKEESMRRAKELLIEKSKQIKQLTT